MVLLLNFLTREAPEVMLGRTANAMRICLPPTASVWLALVTVSALVSPSLCGVNLTAAAAQARLLQKEASPQSGFFFTNVGPNSFEYRGMFTPGKTPVDFHKNFQELFDQFPDFPGLDFPKVLQPKPTPTPAPAYQPARPGYAPPAPEYDPPAPAYTPPAPAYAPPAPAYAPPAPAYAPPAPAYAPPAPAYTPPAPAYAPPAPAYAPPAPVVQRQPPVNTRAPHLRPKYDLYRIRPTAAPRVNQIPVQPLVNQVPVQPFVNPVQPVAPVFNPIQHQYRYPHPTIAPRIEHNPIQPVINQIQPLINHQVQPLINHQVQPLINHQVQPLINQVQPFVHQVQPLINHQVNPVQLVHPVQPQYRRVSLPTIAPRIEHNVDAPYINPVQQPYQFPVDFPEYHLVRGQTRAESYPKIFRFTDGRINIVDFERKKKRQGKRVQYGDGLDPDLVSRDQFLILHGGYYQGEEQSAKNNEKFSGKFENKVYYDNVNELQDLQKLSPNLAYYYQK